MAGHMSYLKSRFLGKLFSSLKTKNQSIINSTLIRNFAAPIPDGLTEISSDVLRTSLKNPRDHTSDNAGMWYTLDPEMAKRLYQYAGLTIKYHCHAEIFRETSFMIREPALSVMDYVRRSDLSLPPNKFLLYGRDGTGKTLSLAHLMHYFADEGWMLVHAGCPAKWSTVSREIAPSNIQEGFFDHTVHAAVWLQHFRQINAPLLENPELTTSESYVFTQRDEIEKGSTLASLVDFGIVRVRYGSECITHLFSELKKHAKEGRIKMAVIIDGVNSLFAPYSMYRDEEKAYIPCERLTIFQAFLNLLQNDWNNGAIICSADIIMSTKDRRKSYLPRYLLGKKGWDYLDPFVPISVQAYSEKEFESVVNYYLDRNWLQHPAGRTVEAKEEMAFVTGMNPKELMELVDIL